MVIIRYLRTIARCGANCQLAMGGRLNSVAAFENCSGRFISLISCKYQSFGAAALENIASKVVEK